MLSARIPVHHQVLNKTWSIINPSRRDAFGYGRRYLPSNDLNWHHSFDRPIGFKGNLRPRDSALDHYRDTLRLVGTFYQGMNLRTGCPVTNFSYV